MLATPRPKRTKQCKSPKTLSLFARAPATPWHSDGPLVSSPRSQTSSPARKRGRARGTRGTSTPPYAAAFIHKNHLKILHTHPLTPLTPNQKEAIHSSASQHHIHYTQTKSPHNNIYNNDQNHHTYWITTFSRFSHHPLIQKKQAQKMAALIKMGTLAELQSSGKLLKVGF